MRKKGRPPGAKPLTPEQKAALQQKALEVLTAWTSQRGKTLKELCAEKGIPYFQYSKLVHKHNHLPRNNKVPKLSVERLEARKTWKRVGHHNQNTKCQDSTSQPTGS